MHGTCYHGEFVRWLSAEYAAILKDQETIRYVQAGYSWACNVTSYSLNRIYTILTSFICIFVDKRAGTNSLPEKKLWSD